MSMHDHINSLIPEIPDVTRRGFIVTSLSIGFAFAVQPIQAQSLITTDTNGLIAGEVKIPVKDGEVPAYRAMPAKGKNFPVVLVIQEVFGVHEHIKDLCRRFAKAGYLAISVELYSRQGDVSKLKEINDVIKIVNIVPDAQVLTDLDAAVAWAKKNNGNTDKLAVTGFCWGGRQTWLYAAHNPKVKAAAAWYGRLALRSEQTADELHPKNPIDYVKDLKVPVIGLYSAIDQGIPMDQVERMTAALKEVGSPSVIHVYPKAHHGFLADYRPSYDKEAAQDAWKKMMDWFKQYGAA